MTDSTLDPQSDKAAREQRAAERLTEWVNAKVAQLQSARITLDASVVEAEAMLGRALDGEWDDCPLAETDPRWRDVSYAWREADHWNVTSAITILEAL